MKTQATEKRIDLIEKAKKYQNVPWCDEYEKMISGMFYDCTVPELVDGRHRARRLALKYNNYFPDDSTPDSLAYDRTSMIKNLFGHIGKNSYIEPPIFLDYGCNISIGDDFYSNFNTTILDCSLVTIGDRVLFGPNVSIYSAGHSVEVQSRREGVEFAEAVTIGNDCWIGGNVTILPGVTIGDGVTIAAGSVVSKDIPSYSVAVGTPARVVKSVLKPIDEK